jgi:hypothetical protein
MAESWAGVTGIVDFAEAANRLRQGKADGGVPFPRQAKSSRRKKRSPETEGDYIDEILRFRCALANLASNNSDPADVIRYMDPLFGDAPLIREHLDHAVRWINRFAEEWGREQTTHGSPRQIQQGSERSGAFERIFP